MGVTGVAWLVDAVSGAPSYTGRLNRQNTSVFLAGATAARPFGATSGVRPGTSTSTVTATSTTWTAQTFAGVIDLEASALAAAYNFAFNQVTSGSVTASNASNPRIDTLSVRIDDPAEGDGTSVPAVTMVYTTGTAAGTPLVPAAPARSFIVAQLNFPAGSGTTPTVTWVAPMAVAAGGIQPVPSSTSYPASPYVGQVVDDAALGYPLRWTGTAWVALSNRATIGTGTLTTASSLNIDTLTGFDEYEIVLNLPTASASNSVAVRVRSGGTSDTSSNYDVQRSTGAATTATASGALAQNIWDQLEGGARADKTYVLRVFSLNRAERTMIEYTASALDATANPLTVRGTLRHRSASAFTGLGFTISTGTVSGTWVATGIRYA